MVSETSETNTPTRNKIITSESPEYTITVSSWLGTDSTSASQPLQLFSTEYVNLLIFIRSFNIRISLPFGS